MAESRTIHALDIGGSGVRHASFRSTGFPSVELLSEPRDLGVAPYERFPQWLTEQLGPLAPTERVGVSCAGFVDFRSGVVRLSNATGWRDEPLGPRLQRALAVQRVRVFNDADAHLLAHLDAHAQPVMCLAMGTSPGFAITNERGSIASPRPGSNYDIGHLTLPTRAKDRHVWAALGAKALAELQGSMGPDRGARHFGNRLGHLVRNLCGIFQPRTVVFTGGLVAGHWDALSVGLREELQIDWPGWLEQPEIVRTPYGRYSALWGAALGAA